MVSLCTQFMPSGITFLRSPFFFTAHSRRTRRTSSSVILRPSAAAASSMLEASTFARERFAIMAGLSAHLVPSARFSGLTPNCAALLLEVPLQHVLLAQLDAQ